MKEKLGIVGAIAAAVLASVCCLGPVVLAGLGLGAVAAAQSFAPYRPLFLALTAVFLGVGFYFAYRKPEPATCEGQVCETTRAAADGEGCCSGRAAQPVPCAPGSSAGLTALRGAIAIEESSTGGEIKKTSTGGEVMKRNLVFAAMVVALVTSFGWAAQQASEPTSTKLQITQCALKVSGMTCEGCAEAVKARLLKLEGVKAATVNHKTGAVTVEYDAKKTSPEKIVSAFNEGSGGFKAELAKPAPKRD